MRERIGRNLLAFQIRRARKRKGFLLKVSKRELQDAKLGFEKAKALKAEAKKAKGEIGQFVEKGDYLSAFGKAFTAEHFPKKSRRIKEQAKTLKNSARISRQLSEERKAEIQMLRALARRKKH